MKKIGTYAIVLFQVILIGSLIRGIQVSINARSRVKSLEEKRDILAQERRELEERLSYVESETYVEKVAREELQLTKPGETMVIVPDFIREVEEKTQPIELQEEKPNYLKWWEVLSGKIGE